MSEKSGSIKLAWKTLASEDDIASLEKNTILFFKHSTRCPISQQALQRLTKDWEANASSLATPCLIEVRQQRSLSNLLTQRYNIEHASPQVLLIVNGKCVYHASHEQIKYEDIRLAAV